MIFQKGTLHPLVVIPLYAQLLATTNLFLLLWICLFWMFHIIRIIYYMAFCVLVLSVSIMLLRFIHVFLSGCTIFQSHQQFTRIPIFPHHCQLLLYVVFFITVILVGVKWHFFVVFTCVSLMANDVWYLVMCLLAIWITSLKKFLFKSISHGTVVEYKSSLYILDTSPLRQIYDLQIFSPILELSFCFLTPE